MTDNPIEALKQIRSLCNPMDAKFDPIRVICDIILNQQERVATEIKDSERVVTVSDMIEALKKMPMDAKVCGSEYVENMTSMIARSSHSGWLTTTMALTMVWSMLE